LVKSQALVRHLRHAAKRRHHRDACTPSDSRPECRMFPDGGKRTARRLPGQDQSCVQHDHCRLRHEEVRIGVVFEIVQIGPLRADAEDPCDLYSLCAQRTHQGDILDQRREASPTTAWVQHRVRPTPYLILQPFLYPEPPVNKATRRRHQSILEERREAVTPVLLIRVPDLELTTLRAKVLHGGVQHCRFSDPLPSQSDPKDILAHPLRSLTVWHSSLLLSQNRNLRSAFANIASSFANWSRSCSDSSPSARAVGLPAAEPGALLAGHSPCPDCDRRDTASPACGRDCGAGTTCGRQSFGTRDG